MKKVLLFFNVILSFAIIHVFNVNARHWWHHRHSNPISKIKHKVHNVVADVKKDVKLAKKFSCNSQCASHPVNTSVKDELLKEQCGCKSVGIKYNDAIKKAYCKINYNVAQCATAGRLSIKDNLLCKACKKY